MIKINLLPVGVSKKKEKIMIQLVVAVLFILATMAGLGLRWYTKKMEIEKVQREIAELKKEINKRQDIQKTLETLETEKNKLESQINAINKLDQGRKFFIRVIDKITESVPRNQVWLTSVRGAGQGGGAVNIKGAAYDQDSIALYMGNLSIIPCDANKSDEMSAEECRERAGSSKEAQAHCDNYKAHVCIEKDRKCRVETEPGKIEKNFEECRRFYRQKSEDVAACSDTLSRMDSRKRAACARPEPGAPATVDQGPDSKACKKITEEINEKQAECEQLKKDNAKLREEEFIRYDSVDLRYVRLQTAGRGAAAAASYIFEINVTPAN